MLRATFFYVVGIAQLVSASDCGSEGPGFESLYPPLSIFGLSPSGKAQGFDPCITLVRIQLAQLGCRTVSMMVLLAEKIAVEFSI